MYKSTDKIDKSTNTANCQKTESKTSFLKTEFWPEFLDRKTKILIGVFSLE